MIICNFPTYNRNNKIAFGNLTKFAQNSCVQNSLNSSVEKISTLKQVDKAIFEMQTGMKITPVVLSKLKKQGKIGSISEEAKLLLDEICLLHEKINTILLFSTDKEIYKLKKEYPNFSKIKPYNSITFNRINNRGLGLTLRNNLLTPHDNIKTIFIRNSQNKVIDVLPIEEGRILKMRDNIDLNKVFNPINCILKNEYLSQDDIESKNIYSILNVLKKELTNLHELISTGGGIVSEELGEHVLECEKEISLIKKQIAIKKIRPNDFKLHPNGAVEFYNINDNGDSLYWLSGDKNKKLSQTTIINLISKEGKFLDGIAINQERILCNYPNQHKDNLPLTPKFYTTEEIKKLCLEEKLDKFLNYFQTGKTAFEENFKKISKLKKNLHNIF